MQLFDEIINITMVTLHSRRCTVFTERVETCLAHILKRSDKKLTTKIFLSLHVLQLTQDKKWKLQQKLIEEVTVYVK